MYTRILVPIDGSDAALKAVAHAIELADLCGARILFYHAVPEFQSFSYLMELLETDRQDYLRHAAERAERYLAEASKLAHKAGVGCESLHDVCSEPQAGIVSAATERDCDLIVMASHSRPLLAMMVGSTTLKVLSHSKVPVLAHR